MYCPRLAATAPAGLCHRVTLLRDLAATHRSGLASRGQQKPTWPACPRWLARPPQQRLQPVAGWALALAHASPRRGRTRYSNWRLHVAATPRSLRRVARRPWTSNTPARRCSRRWAHRWSSGAPGSTRRRHWEDTSSRDWPAAGYGTWDDQRTLAWALRLCQPAGGTALGCRGSGPGPLPAAAPARPAGHDADCCSARSRPAELHRGGGRRHGAGLDGRNGTCRASRFRGTTVVTTSRTSALMARELRGRWH